MDINEIIENSITIANNCDDIGSMARQISSEVKENLFDKNKYSSSITEIIKNRKATESKILLTKELVKQFFQSIQKACNNFEERCKAVITERDEKNAINGDKFNSTLALIPNERINKYYVIDQVKIIHDTNIDNIIKCKEIEEIGTVITLLNDSLADLRSDFSWLKDNSQKSIDLFLKEIYIQLLNLIDRINELILSEDVINSLNHKGTEDDKSGAIIENIVILADQLYFEGQRTKKLVMNISKILSALYNNFDIITEALIQYKGTYSIL